MISVSPCASSLRSQSHGRMADVSQTNGAAIHAPSGAGSAYERCASASAYSVAPLPTAVEMAGGGGVDGDGGCDG